jgi:hypothetical protein
METSLENKVLESGDQSEGTASKESKMKILANVRDNITNYLSERWSTARKFVLSGVLAGGLTLGAIGAAYALPIEITENDGLPDITGTELSWSYNIFNDNPWNQSMPGAILYDVFSTQAPTFGTLHSGWGGISSPGSGANLWDITLSAIIPPAYIGDGTSGDFVINTYISDVTNNVVIGTLYGQGNLPGFGYLPSSPGDPFLGPTGETAEVPAPEAAWLLAAGLLGLVGLKRRNNHR